MWEESLRQTGVGGHQEADEGHEAQRRAFEEGDTGAFILLSFQLPETEAKEGREVKAWKDLSQISLDPHLCYDHPYQGALKSSWLYYNHLEGEFKK